MAEALGWEAREVGARFLLGGGASATGGSLTPAAGFVDFFAAVDYVPSLVGSGPDSSVVSELRVTGVLNGDGYLMAPSQGDPTKAGDALLRLPTNDATTAAVQGWTWTGVPRLTFPDGSPLDSYIPSFTFPLPSGDKPLDLVPYLSVPASPGLGQPQVLAAALAAADSAAEATARAAEAAAAGGATDEKVSELLLSGEKTAAVLAASAVAVVPSAVEAEIARTGVMTGHDTVQDSSLDSAWRQTTPEGGLLPLGYTSGGRLDEFARRIWREDVNRTETVDAHPVYARVAVSEPGGQILWALRWDGQVEIPGLVLPASPAVTPAATKIYSAVPYVPGSDVLPGESDPLSWAMFGSSSAAGIASKMTEAAASRGVKSFDGGVPGELSYHIAARMGSVPALLTFPGNAVPASGASAVTVSNLPSTDSMKPFAGTVAGVPGVLSHSTASSGPVFTRSTAGSAVSVPANAPFIPDLGPALRGATTFLWMGKNNAATPARVIQDTNASFDYLIPLVRRCLVLGHFVDTGTAAAATVRTGVQQINAAYAARYGRAYLDISSYLTGSQVWKDTGITPTAADLAEQALGNKPASLSLDYQHLNAAANAAVQALILGRLTALGWLPPAQV